MDVRKVRLGLEGKKRLTVLRICIEILKRVMKNFVPFLVGVREYL